MPKTKIKEIHSKQIILWAVVAVLALATITFAVLFSYAFRTISNNVKPQNMVSLGSIEYTITDQKATKRSDPSIDVLRSFLVEKAASERCPSELAAYEQLITYTPDETQAFIKYGCGSADSPMHIIKENGKWRSLSPTNNFNYLEIPVCDYVAQNNISKAIAPVCVDSSATGNPSYTVR